MGGLTAYVGYSSQSDRFYDDLDRSGKFEQKVSANRGKRGAVTDSACRFIRILKIFQVWIDDYKGI
jgi:hypothetical protein